MNQQDFFFYTTQLDPSSQKLNIYLTGSRVYGTHTDESDFDFYVIVSEDYYNTLKEHPLYKNQWCTNNIGYQCLYLKSININLYTVNTFYQKLEENWLQALMCENLPQQFIWKHDFEFKYKIYLRRLGRSVIGEAGKHFEMARRKWTGKGNCYKEKKYLVHAFRDLLIGIQFVKQCKIIDFKCANEIYYKIMNDNNNCWKHYEKIYYPIYQKLKKEFNEIITVKERRDEILSVIPFIKERGIDAVRYYFSIKYHLMHKDQLVHLISDLNESPMSSKIVRECNGLILNLKNNSVVCFPTLKFLNYNEHYAENIDWKSSKALLNNGGIFVTMYWFQNQWNVSTQQSPTASELCTLNCSTSDTFWKLFKENHFILPSKNDIDKCFVFSLTCKGQLNEIIQHNNDSLELFAVRDLVSLHELDPEPFSQKYNWKYPSFIHFSNVEEAKLYSLSLNPVKFKGYIIQDKNFHRISVNSSQYISLSSLIHHNTKNKNEQMMLDVVRCNNSEFLEYYPFLKNLYDRIKNKYDCMCNTLQKFFDQYDKSDSFISAIKTFKLPQIDTKNAPECTKLLIKAFTRMYKLNYSSVQVYFAHSPIKDIERLFTSWIVHPQVNY